MVLENKLRVLHLDPQATERNCDTTPSLKACDFKAFLHSHTLSPTRTNLLQQGHSTQLCTPCGLTFKYLILCGSYSSSSSMIPESQAQDLICRCIHFVALWKHFFSLIYFNSSFFKSTVPNLPFSCSLIFLFN